MQCVVINWIIYFLLQCTVLVAVVWTSLYFWFKAHSDKLRFPPAAVSDKYSAEN